MTASLGRTGSPVILSSVERLGATTTICTDKDGALTQNRRFVQKVLAGVLLPAADDAAKLAPLAKDYCPFFMAACLGHDLRTGDGNGQ